MTESKEFYASTIDEAVEKAALELGMSAEEVSYRVLDEGNSGFLGIGARDARIVVEAPAQHTSGDEDEPLDDDPPETAPAENVVVGEPASERSENAGSSTLSEVYGERSETEQVEAPEELLDEIRVLVSSVLD
ncbi:MAG TPA: Jag N-terminal domain-containing protein, partial [Rubrobacter sp.]|nr:Jag N-terminal domain-containing protein [Rubrobacter sp.]